VSADARQPLVLIPGIQGRWEYSRRTVEALGRWFDVLTLNPDRDNVDAVVEEVRRALDDRGIASAVVCGISFGGVVALRFAAEHAKRTRALVLASTPGPDWHLSEKHERYARHPWLYGPVFLLETPLRLRAEVLRAIPHRRERGRFVRDQLRTLMRSRLSFTRMADRARAIERIDRASACARIVVPTLVVTGEPDLDHVVPVGGTSSYAERIRGAVHHVIPDTGHIGSMTRPETFAELVRAFVARSEPLPPERADEHAA
jgi:3-oxoadipate enol-lactonase